MSLETLVDLRHVTVEDVTEGEHLVTLLALVLQNQMERLLCFLKNLQHAIPCCVTQVGYWSADPQK